MLRRRCLLTLVAFLGACGSRAGSAPQRPRQGSAPAPGSRASPPPAATQIAPATASVAPSACADGPTCVAEGEPLRTSPVVLAPDRDAAVARNTRALELFEAACEHAYARGCELVAETLQDHRVFGVPRNDERAAVMWDRACTMGLTHACYRYGFYLWEGIVRFVVVEGAPRPYRWPDDRFHGIELLRGACDQSQREACDLLDRLRAAGVLGPPMGR